MGEESRSKDIRIRRSLSAEKVIRWKEITEWVTPEEAEKLDPVLRAFCWENYCKRCGNSGFDNTSALKLLNKELREFTESQTTSADISHIRALLLDPIDRSIQELRETLVDQDIYLTPLTADELKGEDGK